MTTPEYQRAIQDVIAHIQVSHPGWKAMERDCKGPRVTFILGLLVSDLEEGAQVGAADKAAE